MGVQPTLGYFSTPVQQLLSWAAIAASSLWVAKSWNRSAERYARERDANLLQRQLSKLNIDLSQFLEGRSIEQLKPDELYALAKVLPGFSNNYRLQVYQGTLREALEQGSVTPARSLKSFHSLRQKLEISEELHWEILSKLQTEEPDLFNSSRWQTQHSASTVVRQPSNRPTTATTEETVYRSPHHRT
ncbi:MAG: hypothetical protein HC879_16690 [Leptolyngbyaceae cyanobacterium SL_5_9]|nr:hypothetical protein [Leptolyngbyaceae cyanobacterium SL_5_9]